MAVTINGTTGVAGVDGSASTPALQGSDTNTGVSFGTDTVNINTGGSTRATVDSSGRLLLGDTDSDNAVSDSDNLVIGAASGDNGMTIVSQGGNYNGTIRFSDGSNSGADSYRGTIQYYHGDNYMRFYTDASERMRITSDGSVGINTTSPQAKFQVNDTNPVIAEFYHSDGGTNDEARIALGAYSSNPPSQRGVTLVALNNGAGHDFIVNTSSSHGGGPSEKMRVTSSGAVSVGSTANTYGGSILAANGYYVSAYNGDNLITNASQGGGSATLYIGNAAIQVSSDQRIKKDIVDTTLDATTKLKQVRVVDFKWNDPTDKAEVNRNSRGTWTGCLAQEMVNVFPYTVNAPRKDDNSIDTESERTWGLEYQHLVPALIKGFQEQQAEIETLKTKVAALEAA